jgi:hypothetical protein
MAAVSSAENGYKVLIRVDLQNLLFLNFWINQISRITVLLQIPVCLKGPSTCRNSHIILISCHAYFVLIFVHIKTEFC